MQPIKNFTDELKLYAFYDALQEQLTQSAYDDMPFKERVCALLQAESLSRQNRRIAQLQKEAKLHEKTARFEEIDFSTSRGLHKPMLLDLFSNQYLQHNRNIILTGPTGTGKSYIAQALANKAMIHGHSALYLRVPRLMQLLSSSRGDDEYLKMLARLKRIKLLILDDFGVVQHLLPGGRHLLDPGFVQHRFVVVKILGVEDPRHAQRFTFVNHGIHGTGEDFLPFGGGNTCRDILQQKIGRAHV